MQLPGAEVIAMEISVIAAMLSLVVLFALPVRLHP
jgi:hypothetical protein